jgi:hypothetical protein
MTEDMAQVVECLPSKCKVLGSIPTTIDKTKKLKCNSVLIKSYCKKMLITIICNTNKCK